MSGIDDSLKQQICSYLNFSEGILPVRYLGVPLISKRLSCLDCSALLSRISEKFQNWQKRKVLSYAGRLQLIKSVILGIHIFWTNNYILPSKVLRKIDSLCSEFLWNRKIPLVSWNSVCQNKKQGDLGVFSARIWNQATAIKIMWLIHLKKDHLWVKWIHGNYLSHANVWQVQVKINDSWMWKQIIKMSDMLIGMLGSTENLTNLIDSCCVNGKIVVSAVYEKLNHSSQQVAWSATVWDSLHYPKHSFILWLVAHSRLLTQERLCRMNIINTNRCVLCSNQLETCQHLFFDCQYSASVWNKVMDWLKFNCRSCDWEHIIDWYSCRLRRNNFTEKLKRMALSVSVY
ncbi:uncharacterized protein LOC109821859 [Asparagus officinalis]|uniref:uncharacterized protein LOC109821859 n=1 Tax=Asparagus officinalis TaxID=4686 RepID=UPI00098E3C5F|nr:uncharacterized protein LOC109821859 [Asparagus officinalis]